MRRAERLFRLVNLLNPGHVVTARELADALEVSERTIYRDIAHLQASGVPVDGAAGFGYLASQAFELPALTFTFEQLEALALGARFVMEAGDPGLAAAAAAARDRIQQVLPGDRTRALEASPLLAIRSKSAKAPRAVEKLRAAIRDRRIVRIVYQSLPGEISERELWPLALTAATECWLLGGWCLLRGGFRDFRVERITKLVISAEVFPPTAGRDLEAYIAHHAPAKLE
jgi:predicted DNA-binding transcriptional regulator YafY